MMPLTQCNESFLATSQLKNKMKVFNNLRAGQDIKAAFIFIEMLIYASRCLLLNNSDNICNIGQSNSQHNRTFTHFLFILTAVFFPITEDKRN